MGLLSRASKMIRAFHGSPHDFDQFEWSPRTIGTGEGSQAFGHGLYFAEKEAVAQKYRDALSAAAMTIDGAPFALREYSINELVGALKSNPVELEKALQDYIRHNTKNSYADVPGAQAIVDSIQRGTFNPGVPGRMYEVQIKAGPDELLHLDRPISEQGDIAKERIDAALRSKGNSLEDLLRQMNGSPDPHSAVTGSDLMEGLGNRYGGYGDADADVAALLKDHGVPGLQFWDQASRSPGWRTIPASQSVSGKWVVGNAPNGPNRYFETAQEAADFKRAEEAKRTHNFVVFDDKLIDILRKYGIPATVGGGLLSRVFGSASDEELRGASA